MTKNPRKIAGARVKPSDRLARESGPNTLTIDIGGTGLKASVLDPAGAMRAERVRVETPSDPEPSKVLALLRDLVKSLPTFDRISVGFPGVVRDGIVITAPNLGTESWSGFELEKNLERILRRPVKIANDADLQGLAVISGRGLEMVWTLGTGFGTGLYNGGRLAPHFEWAHHPFRKGETYEEQLGNAAREGVGKRRWNRRVWLALDTMRACVCFDKLYIGGGNAKHLKGELPADVKVVSNVAGILGGIHLWKD